MKLFEQLDAAVPGLDVDAKTEALFVVKKLRLARAIAAHEGWSSDASVTIPIAEMLIRVAMWPEEEGRIVDDRSAE